MCEVSIIVPIYNAEAFLRECIDSILGQSFRDIELVLVDDGSNDGSGGICDEYLQRDSRIKVLHKVNDGPVRARKDGLELATGKYIAFADADDWLEPDMVLRLYSIMEQEATDVAMCGRYEDTGEVHKEVYHGLAEGKYVKEDMLKRVYPKMIVNGSFFEWGLFPGLWDKMFRRECLEPFMQAVDDRITMGDDAACVYPCLLNVQSIYVLHECLYHYRQTSFSMVKQKPNAELERMRFQVLYHSVLHSLEKYKDIYDLTEQWTEYVLFLMTPRADTLYKGIEDLDYLFPFPSVKKGSNIVLYGMGTYGQRLYRFMKETGICNVVALADRNYKELSNQGLPVQAPDSLMDLEYDAIVVASSFAKARTAIYRDLVEMYPRKKVHVMDEKLIKSDKTLRAFGLK